MKSFTAQFAWLAALGLSLAAPLCASVATYQIDPVHSSVAFSIRHFVSKVPGSFTKFSGTIVVDSDDATKNSVEATVDVTSLTTANAKRDAHVKSADFLDAAKFSSIAFKSTSWTKTGEDTFDIAGDLTIHGVTKPAVLKAKLLGVGPGMQGVQLSGWEATTVVKKSDFGVSGPAMLAKVLGDDVTVNISIEADAQK
jgi:polyisoprenoid-binding protein YceI